MLQVFSFLTGSLLVEIIRFKITIYLMIKKNIFSVAKVEFMKMSSPQEKAHCIFWFIETKSDIQAQRNFRCKYGRKSPARPTIRAWHKKFMETGSVLQRKGAG